jgi:uncharacterized protein (TIGR00297 family)
MKDYVLSTTSTLLILAVATVVCVVSYYTRALSKTGLIGFIFVSGGAAAGFGSSGFAYVVFVLFTASVVTRFRYGLKAERKAAESAGGARGIWKILGAGGVTGVLGWLQFIARSHSLLLSLAFVTALAESSADTWASEIGVLSSGRTVSIAPPWHEMTPGLSGGISLLGEFAALVGALLPSILAAAIGLLGSSLSSTLPVVLVGALAGEHVDSILGTTLQGLFYCPGCGLLTDSSTHEEGIKTNLVRGLRSLNNERVNFLSSAAGCACTVLIYLAIVK